MLLSLKEDLISLRDFPFVSRSSCQPYIPMEIPPNVTESILTVKQCGINTYSSQIYILVTKCHGIFIFLSVVFPIKFLSDRKYRVNHVGDLCLKEFISGYVETLKCKNFPSVPTLQGLRWAVSDCSWTGLKLLTAKFSSSTNDALLCQITQLKPYLQCVTIAGLKDVSFG